MSGTWDGPDSPKRSWDWENSSKRKRKIPEHSLFAWVGEDGVGDFGVCSVVTPLGPSSAVFSKPELAEKFTDQMQQRANMLQRPVYLIEYVQRGESLSDTKLRIAGDPIPLTTITPNQNPEES